MLIALVIAAALQDIENARIERLSNGLQVIVVEDRSRPVVSVQLWYRAGSALDNPARPGMAELARQFLEHRDQAALRLRATGAGFDSRTLRDACYFESLAPAGFLDQILSIEARRMRPVEVVEIDIDRLVAAAAIAATGLGAHGSNEPPRATDDMTRRAGAGWPGEPALLAMTAAAFPDHPYGNPPALVSAELAALPAGQLRDFVARWFVPGNAVLLIVGDVPALPTVEAVRQRFGELAWAEPPRRHEYDRPQRDAVRAALSGAGNGVDFGWVTLPWGYFENAAVDGLMHALCNPVDGTLALRLREAELGEPRFERFAWYEAGLLRLSVDAPPDRVDEVERIVRETLEGAKTAIASVTQVNRAAAAMRRRLYEQTGTFRERALRLGAHQIIGGDLLLAAQERMRMDRVSVGDMQKAAAMLADRRRVVLRRTVASRKAPTLSSVGAIAPAQPVLLDAAEALSLLGEFRETGQAPTAPLSSPVHTATTRDALGRDGGITVRVFRRPDLPFATVRTTVPIGLADPLAAATSLTCGSQRHTAEQLRDYLSYHGIEMRPFTDGDRHGLVADGPPSLVPQMVEWQAELMRLPPSDQQAFDSAADGIRRNRARLPGDSAALADHLAYCVAHGIEAQLAEAPSSDALREMRARIAAAEGVSVEIAGPVDEEVADRAAREACGSMGEKEPPGTPLDDTTPLPMPKRSGLTWHAGDADMLEIRVIVDCPPDAARVDTIGRLLGAPDGAATRLDDTRRWRWTARRLDSTTLVASARLPLTDHAVDRVAALIARIRSIETGAVSPEQLETARRLAIVGRWIEAEPELPRSESGRAAGDASGPWRIRVVAVGGDESVRDALAAIALPRSP